MAPGEFPVAVVQTGGLVLARVASIFMTAPVFSHASLPVMMRAAMAFMFSAILFFTVPAFAHPLTLNVMAASVVMQMVLGFLQGLAFTAVLLAAQAAGDVLDLTVGFAFAAEVNPGDSTPHAIMSRLLQIGGLLIFMAMGGHLWILAAMIHSLQVIPLAATTIPHNLLEAVVRQSANVLTVGLQMAAPVVAFLALTDVVVMAMSKAMPQLQILAVTFPIKILLGLIAAAWFMPSIVDTLVLTLQRFSTLVTGAP